MKIKANPGGLIAPENVFGRDQFICQLWQVLAQQSVILLAERRIGKSTVLRKVVKEHAPRWLPLLLDVEYIGSVSKFVLDLKEQLLPYLSKTEQGKSWLKNLHTLMAGAKIASVTLPELKQQDWQKLLTEMLKALGQYQQQQHQQVLLIWDEFPWMLQKIAKNEGHQGAGELLDTLRQCRQSIENLRMLFTGSVGLHQVINTIRAVGYSNEPVNDMEVISLDALTSKDAVTLAKALIAGEGLDDKTKDHNIAELCNLVDNVPYYIHHLMRSIKNGNDSPERIVKAAIAGVDNSWQLEHYYTRLEEYYPTDWKHYALVLDVLAQSETPLKRKQIQQCLAAIPEAAAVQCFADNEQLKQILRHLVADHYLTQLIDDAAYQFRYPLIQKWWCFYRD